MVDPVEQFCKIAEVMSVELVLSRLRIDPPRARRYGYLAVAANVPQFRKFINGLDALTRKRIEDFGYAVSV